jgi:hypothetical protein
MTFYEDGDVVIDDDGRELVITAGNKKYDTDNVYDKMVNQHYVRARHANAEATTILEMVDGLPDFLWFENRIVGKKEEVTV